MLILRLLRFAVLWSLVVVAFAQAWYSSVGAATYDHRVTWALLPCLVAWAGGTAVGAILSRARPRRWPRLDLVRHGLALLTTAICVNAMSHVSATLSIRVLREEIPPFLAPIFPLVCGVLPLWLRASATRRDAAEQGLLLAVFLTALGGAVFFLPPAMAAGLGLLVLLLQFDESHLAPRFGPLLVATLTFLAIAGTASLLAYDRIAAEPALAWITGLTALALAIGVRPRTAGVVRDLVAASVLAALLVALCGVAVTASLAQSVALGPALNSRLVLFQQHPNFLAPFFGFHAVLAVGLGMRRKLAAVPWLLGAALLAASTVMTDSRTGIAAMAAALAGVPALFGLAVLARRWRLRRLVPLALVAGGLLVAGVLLLGGRQALDRVQDRVTRLEASLDFRYDAWRNSVAVIREHPWIGVGPHNFLSLARFTPGSRFFNAPEAPHPHNVFLYVAQAAGLPALAVFLAWMLLLAAGLWRTFRCEASGLPRPLVAALLAGSLGLLVANLFDLGLSLGTLAPAPLFLVTGLMLGTGRREPRPARRWPAVAWASVLFAAFVPLSLQPLRALARVEQGELYSWESEREPADASLSERVRLTLGRALELDPAVPRAAELLAKWHERQPGGLPAAVAVLERRLALAPHDEELLSALGNLYKRAGMLEPAREHLAAALQDSQGSPNQSQDRADLIGVTAKLGRRDEAIDLLADALRLDANAIFSRIAWTASPDGRPRLAVGGEPRGEPIEMAEAAEWLFQRERADQEAGRMVGRAYWMSTIRAFRLAGRDDRASDLLDWAEQHVPPDVLEPWAIASERGWIAFDAGDFARAVEQFDLAVSLSGKAFWRIGAARARQALGETVSPEELTEGELLVTGEILDQPDHFLANLQAQRDALLAQQRWGEAAAVLERTVIFEDDLLARAAIWEQAARLDLDGGRPRDCLAAVSEALVLLGAKPFPWQTLLIGVTESRPGRLAQVFCDACRQLGLDQHGREREFWALPAPFSPLMGPSLFRLAFFTENVQVDKMLREADVQLLADPGNLPALWARLFALEACGRHFELAAAMRDVVEAFGRVANPAQQLDALVVEMQSAQQLENPEQWKKAALLLLLKGSYPESADVFARTAEMLADTPEAAAEVLGWEAMAAFLSRHPERSHDVLQQALRLDPGNEMLELRLGVMPPP